MTTATQPTKPEVKPLERAAHADYFDAIFQAPPTVCGLPLKPLSIGRYRLMAWRNLAFVAEEERVATPGELLIAVLICSMRVDEFMEFLALPDFKKRIEKWQRKVGFMPPRYFSWPIIGRWLDKFAGQAIAEADMRYLLGETRKFQQYILDGSKAPEFWSEADSNETASHWSHGIEVVLRSELGWREEDINEVPLNRAIYDYFRHAEGKGLGHLMSEAEAKELNTPLTPEQAAEANASALKVLEFMRANGQLRNEWGLPAEP